MRFKCEKCKDCEEELSKLSYEEQVKKCSKCRKLLKTDIAQLMTEHNKDPFKGKRWSKGKQSKVTVAERKMIRILYQSGMTQSELASVTGLSQPTVCRILKEE